MCRDEVTYSNNPNASAMGTSLSPPLRDSRVRTISASSHTSSVISTGQCHVGVANPEVALRPFYRKDALFMGSKNQLHHASHASLHSNNPYLSSVADIPIDTNEDGKKNSAFRAFVDILKTMTDFSILKNRQILLICIGNIFSMFGYYLPIMCLVSLAVDDLKIDQVKAAYLLTIFGR